MRKLLIGIALVLPLSSHASLELVENFSTTISCFNTDLLFNELRKEFNEVPFLYGETDDEAKSLMSVWMHKAGSSWTIVATKDDLSCVVGTGKNLKLVPKGKSI